MTRKRTPGALASCRVQKHIAVETAGRDVSGELPTIPDCLDRPKRTDGYQVLPDLSAEDYAALKADIEERGVQVAVEYDQDGNIIDGHHRVRICEELGIEDWPRIVRTYPDDAARRTQARKLNLARRHLDTHTKRKLIEAEIKERPEQSNRKIAADIRVKRPHSPHRVRDGANQLGKLPSWTNASVRTGRPVSSSTPTEARRQASRNRHARPCQRRQHLLRRHQGARAGVLRACAGAGVQGAPRAIVGIGGHGLHGQAVLRAGRENPTLSAVVAR